MPGTPVDTSIYVWEEQKGVLAIKDRLPLELAKTVKHGDQHGYWNECTVFHASKSLLSLNWVCPFYRANDAKQRASALRMLWHLNSRSLNIGKSTAESLILELLNAHP